MSEAPQDYEDLLNTNAEDAVRPPARPGGTYLCTLKSAEDTVSSKKRTKGLEMTFSDLEPQADVDSGAWDEYCAAPMIKADEETMSESFWITAKSLYRIKELCECCGIDPKGKTVLQMVADATGERLLITVQQTVTEKGVYANITGFAKDE